MVKLKGYSDAATGQVVGAPHGARKCVRGHEKVRGGLFGHKSELSTGHEVCVRVTTCEGRPHANPGHIGLIGAPDGAGQCVSDNQGNGNSKAMNIW